jgi:hypothetical protein
MLSKETRLIITENTIAFKSETSLLATGDSDVHILIHAPLFLPFCIHPSTKGNHSNAELKIHALGEIIHTFGKSSLGLPAVLLEMLPQKAGSLTFAGPQLVDRYSSTGASASQCLRSLLHSW